MFPSMRTSAAGDTILDPFCGIGTTSLAALKAGRNSIGVEVDPHYLQMAVQRIETEGSTLYDALDLATCRADGLVSGALPLEAKIDKRATTQAKKLIRTLFSPPPVK